MRTFRLGGARVRASVFLLGTLMCGLAGLAQAQTGSGPSTAPSTAAAEMRLPHGGGGGA
ncbi:MAG: hypothetical protein ACR2GP_08110 [Burkholderiaceae bacterium]